jgi:hypothetical protein
VPHQPPIPDPPRPLTRRAARRAWAEPGVQFWWKSAIVVVLISGYVAWYHVAAALKQRYLVDHGVVVDAKAVKVLGVTEKDNARYGAQRDQSIPVEFEVIMPDGQLVTLKGYLPQGEGWIKVNQEMKLRVDPNDLTHWAEMTDLEPWWRVLAIPLFFMLPVALVLLTIAQWRRLATLRTWQHGDAATGIVVDLKHSATSPLSRLVRFTLADGDDKRVFVTLYPTRAAPAPGEAITLVHPPGRPDKAIAAELYNDPGNAIAATEQLPVQEEVAHAPTESEARA